MRRLRCRLRSPASRQSPQPCTSCPSSPSVEDRARGVGDGLHVGRQLERALVAGRVRGAADDRAAEDRVDALLVAEDVDPVEAVRVAGGIRRAGEHERRCHLVRLRARRRARRERRHRGDRVDDAVVHCRVRRGERRAPRPVVDRRDEALQLATRRTARTRQLMVPGEVRALVESVELALVDRVDPGLDDAVDVREPDLVARGAFDRRPAGQARVRGRLLAARPSSGC